MEQEVSAARCDGRLVEGVRTAAAAAAAAGTPHTDIRGIRGRGAPYLPANWCWLGGRVPLAPDCQPPHAHTHVCRAGGSGERDRRTAAAGAAASRRWFTLGARSKVIIATPELRASDLPAVPVAPGSCRLNEIALWRRRRVGLILSHVRLVCFVGEYRPARD